MRTQSETRRQAILQAVRDAVARVVSVFMAADGPVANK